VPVPFGGSAALRLKRTLWLPNCKSPLQWSTRVFIVTRVRSTVCSLCLAGERIFFALQKTFALPSVWPGLLVHSSPALFRATVTCAIAMRGREPRSGSSSSGHMGRHSRLNSAPAGLVWLVAPFIRSVRRTLSTTCTKLRGWTSSSAYYYYY
jgi:hypothetical protein